MKTILSSNQTLSNELLAKQATPAIITFTLPVRVLKSSFVAAILLLSMPINSAAQDINNLSSQKPFQINGTAGLGFGTYTSSGIVARAKGFSYLFSGNPVVSIYGIAFPLSIVVSDQQKTFAQPFNQYGVSPHYKWLTIHAGWRSLTFSPYTLAGYTFLGVGAEINPGKLRVAFMYGRFNKAIGTDTSVNTKYFSQLPAYRRTGYAARLGFGTEENHFDFIFLKAKDDTNSIKKIPEAYNVTPAENTTLGISMKYRLCKHFFYESDVALSIYTRDLRADTFSSKSLNKVQVLRSLMTLNASTQFLTAGQMAVGYQSNSFSLKAQYSRVDPNYQTMGAYYFETDVENYTIAPTFYLFKHKLNIGGSLGFQNDNILKDKAQQSKKTIGNVNIGFNLPKFGFSIQYSNYGIRQDRGLNPVIDTLRVARTNHFINAMLRFSLGGEKITHSIVITGNYQALVDLNNKTAAQSETNSKTGNISYQLGFNNAGLDLSAIYNYTVADAALFNTVIQGPSIGLDKQLFKSKLLLSSYVSYQLQDNNNATSGHFVSSSFTGSYKLSRRNGVNVSLNYLKSTSGDITNPAFNEFTTHLIYTYTF